MSVKATSIDPHAMELPAYYVNHFQIASFGGLLRISLAEATETGKKHFRTAAILSNANAKEMALSILNLLGTSSTKPS